MFRTDGSRNHGLAQTQGVALSFIECFQPSQSAKGAAHYSPGNRVGDPANQLYQGEPAGG